jgi:uncharacterized protein
MKDLVYRRRAELAELCERLHVQRLELFGSAAGGRFDPASSDLDFIVEFKPLAPAAYTEAYFSLKEGLESLFGRPVDLITGSSLENPYFRESIEACREQVYAA